MEMESDELRRAQSMTWQGRVWEGMPANDAPEDAEPWLPLVGVVLGFDLLVLAAMGACLYAPTLSMWWGGLLQSMGVGR